MTMPGNDTPDPVDGDQSAAPAGPGRRVRRVLLVLVVGAAVLGLVLGVALLAKNRAEPNPLDADAPALDRFTFRPAGECRYEPDRGGLVAHLNLRTRAAGRFTVDVSAVTDEGAENLDISTTHVVRFTVPFYGGPRRLEFDVVVPLTEAEYQAGYRQCRYDINGNQ